MKVGGVEITTNRVIVALAVLINIQGGIGHGSISMTNMVPAGWIDPIISWNNFLAYVGTAIMGALAAPGAFTPRPVSIPTIVKILLVVFLPLGLLRSDPAMAQAQRVVPRAAATPTPAPNPQLPLSGNPAADLANLLGKFKAAPAPVTPDEIQNTTCDFSIFSKLTLENAVPLLQKCTQMVENGTIAPLVGDAQKALDSAKAFNNGAGDGTAIACLAPGLALLTAAQGSAAVKDASGTVTTPAQAVGVFLIGQKLREFVELGGPSNCKTAVQSTLNGLMAAGL